MNKNATVKKKYLIEYPHKLNEMTINNHKIFKNPEEIKEIKTFWVEELNHCLKTSKEAVNYQKNSKISPVKIKIREKPIEKRIEVKKCKRLKYLENNISQTMRYVMGSKEKEFLEVLPAKILKSVKNNALC